ncbi:MAG: hypothetical protein KF889_01665 [Alphaproteobacteria bacterium]|nr:hypothetical protein [Alphaproteobacteria bacterium]MCW5741615.1 hypothetical protein [Alphaproteobacteria bacterium]
MLRLMLIHGRHDPNEEMSDWGFNGPDIEGVEALHVTYQSTFVLHFVDKSAAQKAHAQTGWPHFDDDALELQFHDDMLMTLPVACDGEMAFYGDWELQVCKEAAHG